MSAAAGKRTGSKARSGLMSSIEEMLNKEEIIKPEEFTKASTEEKLGILSKAVMEVNSRFSTVHEIINEASDGLDPRTSDCEEKIVSITEENKQLRFELDLLKGSFYKLENENSHLRNRVVALTAQTMKNNLTIGGLCADEYTENTIDTVLEFLVDQMELEVNRAHIISARRIGIPAKPDQPRLMAIELNPSLRDLILSNLTSLKVKLNQFKRSYNISKQLPDQWSEERRQLREAVDRAKKINAAKSDAEEKDVIEVRKGKLYVNRIEQKIQTLPAPKVQHMFVDKAEQDKIDRIKVHNSSTTEEQGSKFTAFATRAQSMSEVKRAYIKMRQTFPRLLTSWPLIPSRTMRATRTTENMEQLLKSWKL